MLQLRGRCPQCRTPLSWRRRLLTLVCWWPQWRCDGCGAWMEVRFSSQMAMIYLLLPAGVIAELLLRWPRPRALWVSLGLAALWVWLTSRLVVVHWSSTHCHACGYPLRPLKEVPPEKERICPECGVKT